MKKRMRLKLKKLSAKTKRRSQRIKAKVSDLTILSTFFNPRQQITADQKERAKIKFLRAVSSGNIGKAKLYKYSKAELEKREKSKNKIFDLSNVIKEKQKPKKIQSIDYVKVLMIRLGRLFGNSFA